MMQASRRNKGLPLVKPLCRVCERPTADGAIHVAKLRLKAWFLRVCGHEMANRLQNSDLVCYFCIWHAEFLAKYDAESKPMALRLRKRIPLNDAAKVLRKNYFGGRVEQCWVQLEKIPEDEKMDKPEAKDEMGPACTFVEAPRKKPRMQNKQKGGFRCEYRVCASFFNSIEEREKHEEQVHDAPRPQRRGKCSICSLEISGKSEYRNHVRKQHPEFPVFCAFQGCCSFFGSEEEMKTHLRSAHKKSINAKILECDFCLHRASNKVHLEEHIAVRHLAKTLPCHKCERKFSTERELQKHLSKIHVFKVCRICSTDVSALHMPAHLRIKTCSRCNCKLLCLGLSRLHSKSCSKKPANANKPRFLTSLKKIKLGGAKLKGK